MHESRINEMFKKMEQTNIPFENLENKVNFLTLISFKFLA